MASFTEYITKYNLINQNNNFSQEILQKIRQDLSDALRESKYQDRLTIVATGSYGRSEASKASDLDLFLFFDSDQVESVLEKEKSAIAGVVKKYTDKEAGNTGTFGADAVISFSTFLINIGGDLDNNKSLTRRMLFLLEGTWLYGKERFNEYRTNLLDTYIKEGHRDNQVPLFLLNDIIRYYRTIATDFEFKVGENGKSWGLRNIKLRYSRKLLYFGGLICVAEAADLPNSEKLININQLLNLSPLERIFAVGENNAHTNDIFSAYDNFLCCLNSEKDREALECVTRENRENSPQYVKLRDDGRTFSLRLEAWLKEQYKTSAGEQHRIHHALIF